MNSLIKLEELLQLVLCYLGTLWVGFDWWLFWALILAPDLGMLGYLINSKVGAITYNLLHHKGVAILFGMIFFYTANDTFLFIGLLLYGHSSMDRVFGYGLKYNDDFKHTHLGYIGNHK